MSNSSLIRRSFLKLYLFVCLVSSLGIGLILYQAWQDYKIDVESALLRQAKSAVNVLDGILIDADKVLEVARGEIAPKGEIAPPASDVYKSFVKSKSFFNSYFTDSPFGLMLYIDRDGIVRATSQEYPTKPVDLSDRLYFETLKKSPSSKYSLGVLVFARTTGLATFHIALPVTAPDGKFFGILAQQVVAKEAASKLKGVLDSRNSEILAVFAGNKVMFRYPEIQTAESGEQARLTCFERLLGSNTELIENAIFMPASKECSMSDGAYVTYAQSKPFGFRVYVQKYFSEVLAGFMGSISILLVFFGLAFLGISYFFFHLYRSSVSMNEVTNDLLTDQLTKIANRRALDSEFPRLWKDAIRTQSDISALFIDIDFFKKFNDEYGHEHGDLVLAEVAGVIRSCINRPLDFLCRWGGEEFVVILPNTDLQGAIKIAECVRESVRDIVFTFCHTPLPHVTVSIGVSTLRPTRSMYSSDLVDLADKAMYISKQTGRDRVTAA